MDPRLWWHIPYGDVDGWAAFLSEHAAQHTLIHMTLIQANRPQYQAFPLADGGGPEWLWANWLEHQSVCIALGLPAPSDLSSYDISEQDQYIEWMKEHADDHLRINRASGII